MKSFLIAAVLIFVASPLAAQEVIECPNCGYIINLEKPAFSNSVCPDGNCNIVQAAPLYSAPFRSVRPFSTTYSVGPVYSSGFSGPVYSSGQVYSAPMVFQTRRGVGQRFRDALRQFFN